MARNLAVVTEVVNELILSWGRLTESDKPLKTESSLAGLEGRKQTAML